LLKNGANINAITKFKRNSLHIATLRGYLNVVKVLYKFKIDFNAVDQDGNTALHFAAEGGYKDIIQFLLSIYCTLRKNR
jgi:ankyrin repeat protein